LLGHPLDLLANLLAWSRQSLKSFEYILVHGVTKFVEMLKNSLLPKHHKNDKPLHCEQDYDVFNRKLQKMVAKNSWYEASSLTKKTFWRSRLPTQWIGEKPSQRKIPGMKFSTVLKVPSTRDGRLVKALADAEYSLAKSTGYQVKMVEMSGKPLSNFFPQGMPKVQCHKAWCAVCSESSSKKPTMCGLKSVVYHGTCRLCENSHRANPDQAHKGIYVGQTYRTLSERAR